MKSWNPVRSLRFLSGCFVILSFGVSAQAQNLLWNPAAPIIGDSNLITSGTEFDALLTNPSANAPISVDGLKFNFATPTSGMPSSASDGLISWQITSGDVKSYSWNNYFKLDSSLAFDALIDSGGVYSDGGSATGVVTLSGLTKGDLYSVQVFEWAADGDLGQITLSGQISTTLNDGGSASSSGEYALGAFVATGPVETFDWSGDGSSYTPLGPISVQDFGYRGPTDVPEPSTYALMFCGMTLLFFWHWFRRLKTSPKALADTFEVRSR